MSSAHSSARATSRSRRSPVPTETLPAYRPTHARNFVLRGIAWSIGIFGLIRFGPFAAHAIVPLTEFQAWLAATGFGAPALPIDVSLACSGAYAIALCAGAILAYPAAWRPRVRGAAIGIALILALNIVRIGTLGRAVGSGSFAVLHVYVWPALLTIAVAGYVLTWMRFAEPEWPTRFAAKRRERRGDRCDPRTGPITSRFLLLAVLCVGLFTAASPFYLESRGVLAIAAYIARMAAFGLRAVGVGAVAAGNVLTTDRGAFLVTQECISTPLIPVYLAAVVAYPLRWPRRAIAIAAVIPVFVGLGVARLLVVALPAALIGSPMFLIHAFYQLLLAAVVVLAASVWRHGASATAWQRASVGAALGSVVAYLVSPLYARVLAASSGIGVPLEDPQGAVALLPM